MDVPAPYGLSDREQMSQAARSFTSAASTLQAVSAAPPARPAEVDALLQTTAEGYGTGMQAIDTFRSRYTAPRPEWITWEAQAREGWQLLNDVTSRREPGTLPEPAVLEQIGERAHAGASLLMAWTG